MINERQQIKKALYAWVAAVVAETGRTDPVIWNNGKGPRPVPPFISVEFTGSQTPGLPDYGKVTGVENDTDDGEQQIRQFVKKTMTMYAFGEGAIDLLETVKTSIFREDYINALYKKGLVIPQAMDIVEGPEAKDNEIENSASFDFVVTFTRIITNAPGWIGRVQISSETPVGNIDVITTNTEED
jgi:hypothetical protein